jgi:hypothetical protein
MLENKYISSYPIALGLGFHGMVVLCCVCVCVCVVYMYNINMPFIWLIKINWRRK